ncbi:mandelate racemase/muconate lactonizing enzyme family protein [Brucella pseudogrignonensis]|uniref:mandelate racemase/muconate lactonizing enzyme family protein n=1 Tax=Brucella pseudogrignonensis TaxID=419475 RepID=UPI00190AD1E0|nr:mandelate racemase/muconate lactonizing enzyme family protein [Brucella pseudogrignonensis]MBK0019901.1 mandelate racemase/muconate lactonizing enzyme family protein [Ochrobactrum sp. S45]MBK0043359.1 mandelate racemase/muconate lactonizing enzyme family protein [Ochrobactrum sp. S46]UKK93636.1 mandelate racemase/muconate lactonizing enzyme family protein [Brucella pseudogrignonensis]
MKITAIETVQLPHLNNILWVQVHTDEGIIGLGETFRGANGVAAYIHSDIAPQLVGQNPLEIDRISKLLLEPYVGFRSSGVEIRAASAIDIALWDIFGQLTNQPIHQLLGGLSRPSIRTYNTCAGYTYNKSGTRRYIGDQDDAKEGPYEDQLAFHRDAGALAQSLLSEGITAMKIWPFDPFAVSSGGNYIHATDLDKALVPFRQIRDAVGDQMEIMVEFHSMWDLTSALTIARELKAFRPFWSEDPIKMMNPQALAVYARQSGIPVCASETMATRAQFLDVLRADASDYVMLDISWCGGLSEAKKIATMAEAFQRPIAPHDCTGPVVFAASIHLSLNAPNAIFQESVRAYYTSWYRDLVTVMPRIEKGVIYPFEGAGLGLKLSDFVLDNPDVVRRKTGAV